MISYAAVQRIKKGPVRGLCRRRALNQYAYLQLAGRYLLSITVEMVTLP